MMKHEFTEITGIYPTVSMYKAIEAAYMESGDEKRAFCQKYVQNTDGLASRIQEEADKDHFAEIGKAVHEIRARDAVIANLKAEIEALKEQVEREQEWKISKTCGTHMAQDDYDHLLASCTGTSGDPKVMTDEEAKQLVADEFGFRPENIIIVEAAQVFEVNRHRELRLAKKYDRRPLYDATDWNYVRFNVHTASGVTSWEMVNGDLIPYEH